jgi:hypothetical protein
MNNQIEQSEDVFNELVSFLRSQFGCTNIQINRQTIIEDDLGITGDEAEELISAFSKKYNIDVSIFCMEEYFYDEPGIFNIQNRAIKPFTVGYLEKAIIAGRLDEDVINS